MKHSKFIYALFLWFAIGHVAVVAQSDWLRVLSGTIKAGKAATISDADLAKAVRQEVAKMDAKTRCVQPIAVMLAASVALRVV